VQPPALPAAVAPADSAGVSASAVTSPGTVTARPL